MKMPNPAQAMKHSEAILSGTGGRSVPLTGQDAWE
jgi:hypothetical protein